jgi:hypothetical protein
MDKKMIVYIVEKADGRFGLDIETGLGDGLRDGVFSAHVDDLPTLVQRISEQISAAYRPAPSPVAPARASKLQWLEWFYHHADFGPADSDEQARMKERFIIETGLLLPSGYEAE